MFICVLFQVNGFCGHKDINFEYLKNVIFKFLISRDSQSIHLTKAIATLLEFTPAEEKLLRETMEWKMSWWPTSKPRHQKKTRLLAYPSGDPRWPLISRLPPITLLIW